MARSPRRTPKKPPAPSVHQRRPAPDVTVQIMGELYTALERLGADEELLAIVGSWRDTLDDAEILALLRRYNGTG